MRIEKKEAIFLSEAEAATWSKFSLILEAIERESNDSDVLDTIGEIMGHMSDLWEKIESVE